MQAFITFAAQKFGFLFDLINFLTLRNEKIFSFPLLNRNFALSLQRFMYIREEFIEINN